MLKFNRFRGCMAVCVCVIKLCVRIHLNVCGCIPLVVLDDPPVYVRICNVLFVHEVSHNLYVCVCVCVCLLWCVLL
jgi:hypothetical protein